MHRSLAETSEDASLWAFLAVLLCTMGALLTLLVVLANPWREEVAEQFPETSAVERPLSDARSQESSAPATDENAPMGGLPEDAVALAKKLELARQREQEFERIRAQIEERRREEQQRLSHIEEHARRLEHELAQLQAANQRLLESEQAQSVDREQAERERQRLQELAESTEEQLDKLRQEAGRKKSFAIVPYRGPNGTQRRPIYVECTQDGVILQPEGIKLTSDDFLHTERAGNPLAAAIRAAREHLNAQARLRGEEELPDPYPLLLIRPRGVNAYAAALAAVRSWDADYGYEFVEEDWKIEYGLPDPQLSQAMHHAVLQAREREAMLAQLAPSRYARVLGSGGRGRGGRGMGGGAAEGRGSGGQGAPGGFEQNGPEGVATENGEANGAHNGAIAKDRYGLQRNASGERTGQGANGSGGAAGNADLGENSENLGQSALVAANGNPNAANDSSAASESEGGGASESAGHEGHDGKTQSAGTQAVAGGAASAGATSGRPGGAASGGTASGGAASGGAGQQGPGVMVGSSVGGLQDRSLAGDRGQGWALDKSAASSSPLRRPIQAMVRADGVVVLPNRHVADPDLESAANISFDQSAEKIGDQLVAALRTQTESWGIAGRGLYWRPVLVLNVQRGAERQAALLSKLLEESGVDVQLPEMALAPEEARRRGRK